MSEMSVEELKARLDKKDGLVLVDVREQDEAALCSIPGAKLIPLGELGNRFGELDPKAEIAVHCRSGGRSARAVAFLKSKGYSKAVNVAGGILAWAEKIDPSMPTY
jgi:adenylyltransferase/sulfurtransferase